MNILTFIKYYSTILIYNLFSLQLSVVLFLLYYYYKYYKRNEHLIDITQENIHIGRIYKSESLCGGFLNDVIYDTSNYTCQIPCNITNSYKIITVQPNIACPPLPQYVFINGNSIIAKTDVIIKQHVMYNRIHNVTKKILKKGEKLRLKSEMIEVTSSEINGSKISKWYLNFIPKPIKVRGYGSKLSVHIIMFDGGSRYVLKHQLPHTVEYLKSIKNESVMFDMLKYHSLHHNSKGNMLPFFYGYRFNFSHEENNFHRIVFENFKDEYFITIDSYLSCDKKCDNKECFMGRNNYSGSDHNIVPPSCDRQYMKNVVSHNPRCLGNVQIHKLYFEYYKQALKYYHLKKQPVFSVNVMKDSHDPQLLSIPRIDIDFANYLKYLKENGIMDKSVIIITADHGMHYWKYYQTPFGKVDHSLPILFMIFPKSFIYRNRDIYQNLFINQNRFITSFDIHKTLLNLAYLGKKKDINKDKEGVSLFNEIPINRTCYSEKIKFGCSCRVGIAQLDEDKFDFDRYVPF